jgi:uncharacterized Ntn-hydrolase superfamily protein
LTVRAGSTEPARIFSPGEEPIMKPYARSLLLLLIAGAASAQEPAPDAVHGPYDPSLAETFSIIGREPSTGLLGVAVQSRSLAVGSRVRGGKGGVAVFAHQAGSNPMYSEMGVQLILQGMTPEQALEMMLRADPQPNRRQVTILDMQGRTAAWTSPEINDWKGHKCGVDFCASGNSLTGPAVVDAMARTFEASTGKAPLAELLLEALTAGQTAGGQTSGMQSAGLLIYEPLSQQGWGDRQLDLRVDDSKKPFVELKRLLEIRRSQDLIAEARTCMQSGDFQCALDKSARARDKHPDFDAPVLAQAEVHLRMGDKTKALQALREAVRINPANRMLLPRQGAFASLKDDPDFLSIIGTSH